MRRLILIVSILTALVPLARANQNAQGWCESGAQVVVTSGLISTTQVQASYPSCTVTVFLHGGGLATIYSDNNNTPLANPFTAQSGGRWLFYGAAGRYDIQMSGGGLPAPVTYSDIILSDAQVTNVATLPNTTLTFSATPAFFATSNISYEMTLTGNVTSSTITGAPANGNLLSLTLTEDATGGRTFAFPANFVFTPSFVFNTTASAINELTFKFDGTNWHLISNGGGTGGAGNPAGAFNSIQKNNAGVFGAASASDNGTVFITTDDSQHCGPNPAGVDVRCFGVRVVNPNIAPAATGITATINSGSASATLSAASTFINGDGVVIYGAGTANGMSTPSAPTVVASLAAAPTNSGYVVNAPAGGSNTRCYKLVARSKGQGLTAASAETCVTGPTLGSQSLSLTNEQMVASSNVASVTTAARSPEVLAVGMEIAVSGTTNDLLFGGYYIVASVPNNTTFTYQTPSDTRAGASTAVATGGTITYWVSNHVTAPAPGTNVWQYYIYAGATGVETLFCPTQVVNSALNTDPSYLTWDDYGSPYTTACSLPAFVPNTPPVSAVANSLVTTISSGAGTTSLTLAATAGTSVTNSTIRLDSTPGVLAAFAAQAASQGMIYFPTGCCVVFNSIADLTQSGVTTGAAVAGNLWLGDTLVTKSIWNAVPTYLATPAFNISPVQTIDVVTANPGILIQGGNWSGFDFQAFGNGYNAFFINSNGGIPIATFTNCAFTGSGASDYSGVLFTEFTNATAGANGAGVSFKDVVFTSNGPGATPTFISKNVGEVYIDGLMGAGHGILISNLGTIGGFTLNEKYEIQGPITPLVTARGVVVLSLTGLTEDTGTQPIVALLSPGIYVVPLNANAPSGNIPRISGYPPFYSSGVSFLSASATNGLVNTSGFFTGVVNDGTFNSGQTVQVDQTHRMIGSGYSLFTNPGAGQPAAPTCSVVSAGPPFTAAGTYNFNYFPIYANGGWGVDSATSNSCTPNGTSQQVQITISPVAGATQYVWFYNGNNLFPVNGVGCNNRTTLLTFNLENVGACGFNSLPGFPGGGPAGVMGNTVWGITGQFGTVQSIGVPNVTGCSITNSIGGNSAGSFQSGTTGTCTVTITPGITAANGFACGAKDLTTPADEPKQTGYTTTTATLSWTTVSGDLITWECHGF